MGIGGGQLLLIILILVILFFAPSKIAEVGKSLAQAIRGFRKGMTDDETDVTHSVKREKLDQNSEGSVEKKAAKETEKEKTQ